VTFNDEHAIETYKSLINIGTEGLKVLLLLNGGATMALLGYLGQVSSRSQVAPRAFLPILVFLCGLVAAGLTFFFTHLTQYGLYNEGNSPRGVHGYQTYELAGGDDGCGHY
jgi:hypothetical protein